MKGVSENPSQDQATAFLLGEFIKSRTGFRRRIDEIRREFRIAPAFASDREEGELDMLIDTRLDEWRLANPARADALDRKCLESARCVGVQSAEGAVFVRACVLVEPCWFVTLRPWPAMKPLPTVDAVRGEAYVMSGVLAFYRTWIDRALQDAPPAAREAFDAELRAVLLQAQEQARYMGRVVIEMGVFSTTQQLRQALSDMDGLLAAALRQAYPLGPPARLFSYTGDLKKNFRWYRQWKTGRSIAEIVVSDQVDRSHVSRVVHGIDRMLNGAVEQEISVTPDVVVSPRIVTSPPPPRVMRRDVMNDGIGAHCLTFGVLPRYMQRCCTCATMFLVGAV